MRTWLLGDSENRRCLVLFSRTPTDFVFPVFRCYARKDRQKVMWGSYIKKHRTPAYIMTLEAFTLDIADTTTGVCLIRLFP